MRRTLFNEKRTTQAAAFFLFKAGGKLPVLKLMKLLYLAERESYRQYGEPISGDNLVSMPHGPVLSQTLNLMFQSTPVTGRKGLEEVTPLPNQIIPLKGEVSNRRFSMNGASLNDSDGWNSWIEGREGSDVGLRDLSTIRSPEKDLKELSVGDLEVLSKTWDKYGHFTKFALVNLTHSGECPEWIDPKGSSHPIPMKRLFESLGCTGEFTQAALQHLNEQREMIAALG